MNLAGMTEKIEVPDFFEYVENGVFILEGEKRNGIGMAVVREGGREVEKTFKPDLTDFPRERALYVRWYT